MSISLERVTKSTLLAIGIVLTGPLLVLLFLIGEEIFRSLTTSFFSPSVLFGVILLIILFSVFFLPIILQPIENHIKTTENHSIQENKKKLNYNQLLEVSNSKPIFPEINCAICRLSIKEREKISECPYCGVKGHTGHFKEWLRIKSICPNCRTELREDQLVTVTQEPEKLVVPKRECWVCQTLLEFTQQICPQCNTNQICPVCNDYIEYLDNRVVCPECKTVLKDRH